MLALRCLPLVMPPSLQRFLAALHVQQGEQRGASWQEATCTCLGTMVDWQASLMGQASLMVQAASNDFGY
jgi:hypothetical protein